MIFLSGGHRTCTGWAEILLEKWWMPLRLVLQTLGETKILG